MNAKAVVPLILAVVLGLVAAVLVKNAMSHKTPTAQGNMVSVVVAKQGVDPGKQLSKEDLIVSQVPTEAAPGQVFSDPAQLVGRVVTTPLVKGQAILETLLAPTGTGGGLQALIPPGMRAFTVDVTEYSGVGGMLQPGCKIDVISVVHDEKSGAPVARTILQNVKISAIGHNTSNAPPADGQAPPPPSNAITLLLTPPQAQLLQLAMTSSGRPWFVLRSGRDGQELPLEGTTLAELRGDSDQNNNSYASAPTAPADGTTPADTGTLPSKRVVQIFRGGAESQVTVFVPASHSVAGNDTSPALPN